MWHDPRFSIPIAPDVVEGISCSEFSNPDKPRQRMDPRLVLMNTSTQRRVVREYDRDGTADRNTVLYGYGACNTTDILSFLDLWKLF